MKSYKPIVCYSTQNNNILFDYLLSLTKPCHIERDHLANFYISLEKSQKLRYLCDSMNYLHKIRHDDAQDVCELHGC